MKEIIIDLNDISDSREIMESRETPGIQYFIYILLSVIIVAIILACTFKIDEYSRVQGEIKTHDAVSTVISPNNCKIKEIFVSEGQNVKKGDILFELDSDYAQSQKNILNDKLNSYKSDLTNTKLLKTSIEQNKNLLKNNDNDSKYYYRFEQYQNGIFMTAQESESSSLTDSLSKQEKENNLEVIKKSISDKKNMLVEYKSLLYCVENDMIYFGTESIVNSDYNEYAKNYEKANLICEQNKETYENIKNTYNEQCSKEKIPKTKVEKAEQESKYLYSDLNNLKTSYLSDIHSEIIIIENQLMLDCENPELKVLLDEYKNLMESIQKGKDFYSANENIQTGYQQFLTNYNELYEKFTDKSEEYQQIYNDYLLQNSETVITDIDVSKAENTYTASCIDCDSIKNSFISQINSKINSLNDEIQTLESNKTNLEISLKNIKRIDEYEKLSMDKLKNDAIITLNNESDTLSSNISSIQSQITELDELIKNSKIRASVDGTVTLITEFNKGDTIQAGSSLCSIIPENEKFKVLLYIPENEITKIKTGQKTEYIIDSLPYNEYGRITGKILSISADSISNGVPGNKYYIAEASISTNSLKSKSGDKRNIKSGMLLEAKSISGSKKIIVWLLDKINFID